MSKRFVLCLVAAFGVMGCGDDVKPFEPSTSTRCNAAYAVNSSGRVCYFGECHKYDNDLRNHYCPMDAPLCMEDEHGQFYCGVQCPYGTYEVAQAAEFASMCKKINVDPDIPPIDPDIPLVDPDDKCSVTDCLAAKGHENWANAKCSDDDSCIVTQCRDGYTLYDNSCLPALQCCGDMCTNCTDIAGWKDGTCTDGKCVADSCMDGYVLSKQNDGSVLCEFKISLGCSVDSDCSAGQVCDVETGMCVCADGLSYCKDWCYNLLHDDEHCGDCNTSCTVEHGDGHCIEGVCQLNCFDGYVPSADGLSCIMDGGECSTVGESHCVHVSHGYEITKCMDNHKWEVAKACTLEGGGMLAGCSDDDCFTMCSEDYVQNPEQTACSLKSDPCVEGEYRCNDIVGGREYLHCKNSKWEQLKNCKYDHSRSLACTAEEGCIFECDKGYILNEEGTQCVFDSETACTNGETRCGGMEFHRCVNNHWTVVDVCQLQGPHGYGAHCDAHNGCEYWCFDNNVLCDKGCADLQKDYDNCGSCGNVCSSGKCVQGVCK